MQWATGTLRVIFTSEISKPCLCNFQNDIDIQILDHFCLQRCQKMILTFMKKKTKSVFLFFIWETVRKSITSMVFSSQEISQSNNLHMSRDLIGIPWKVSFATNEFLRYAKAFPIKFKVSAIRPRRGVMWKSCACYHVSEEVVRSRGADATLLQFFIDNRIRNNAYFQLQTFVSASQ